MPHLHVRVDYLDKPYRYLTPFSVFLRQHVNQGELIIFIAFIYNISSEGFFGGNICTKIVAYLLGETCQGHETIYIYFLLLLHLTTSTQWIVGIFLDYPSAKKKAVMNFLFFHHSCLSLTNAVTVLTA